mgnify:CR=1 FL=1
MLWMRAKRRDHDPRWVMVWDGHGRLSYEEFVDACAQIKEALEGRLGYGINAEVYQTL